MEICLFFQVLKHPEKSFKNGQAISATVTGTDVTETNLCLSLTGIVESYQQDPTAYDALLRGGPALTPRGKMLHSRAKLYLPVGQN